MGAVLAEMKIPRSIHGMDELDEAIAKATKKEKPLVIVYTDPLGQAEALVWPSVWRPFKII